MQYYVIKDRKSGNYYRGKGENRWGKYFNQASIFRVEGQVKFSFKEIKRNYRKEDVDPVIICIRIIEEGELLCEEK